MYTSFHGEKTFFHNGIMYLDWLSLCDRHLAPRSYFEIGTHSGESLNRFSCDAVCVDPEFLIKQHAWKSRRRTFLYQMSSDDFFADIDLRTHFPAGPDIGFLDGMHWSEYLLRDFIAFERKAHSRTLVFLHDCLPLNVRMTDRVARAGDEVEEGPLHTFWTGDVWRVLFALKNYRPDLQVAYLDCPHTGLVAISGLDPTSTVLGRNYDKAVREMMALELDGPRMRELWNLYPMIDTARLAASPADVSAVLNCR